MDPNRWLTRLYLLNNSKTLRRKRLDGKVVVKPVSEREDNIVLNASQIGKKRDWSTYDI